MEKTVKENGVEITVKENHDKPTTCATFYNPVMKICREFVLCCLATRVENAGSPLKCLEAFGATGIGGLQWKRHLADKVVVTINDKDPDAVNEILKNAERNGFQSVTNKADDNVTSCRPDIVNEQIATAECVEVTEGDCNVLLHQRQFSFIHLDPYGCTVQYLDAAFRNIYNHGVMVITATDVAALYGKHPQVTMRNYGVYSVKTDYTKKLAVRILLAAAARSAAQCNKGFDVLYCVGVELFIQVAVQIRRGPSMADKNLENIHTILHCQMCEEWAKIPNSRAPTENPYTLLPCSCHEATPGKTAVKLGPMWLAGIFSPEFTGKMKQTAKKLNLSERITSLLTSIHEEAVCPDFKQKILLDKLAAEEKAKEQKCEKHNAKDLTPESGQNKNTVCNGNKDCQNKTEEPSAETGRKNEGASVKRTIDSLEEEGGTDEPVVVRKKMRLAHCDDNNSKESSEQTAPHFFYNPNKRKIKGVDIPKQHKLVTLMQREGFRASRTHFDPLGLRTDATLHELREILTKYHSNKK